MDERFWKRIELACAVVGCVCAIVTTVFTIGLFYGWNNLPPSPPPAGATVSGAPWWLYILGLIGLALLVTAWAMILRRGASTLSSSSLQAPSPADAARDAFLNAMEGEAHEALELFISEYLGEAYLTHANIQLILLGRLCDSPTVQSILCFECLTDHMGYELSRAFSVSMGIKSSPIRRSTVGEMIEAIYRLENGGFKQFRDQGDQLAKAANADLKTDPELKSLWESYKADCVALYEQYGELRRQRRFDLLYRPDPHRPQRWGEPPAA
jgi:hypothetical protein